MWNMYDPCLWRNQKQKLSEWKKVSRLNYSITQGPFRLLHSIIAIATFFFLSYFFNLMEKRSEIGLGLNV